MAYTDEIQLYKTKLDDILAKSILTSRYWLGLLRRCKPSFMGGLLPTWIGTTTFGVAVSVPLICLRRCGQISIRRLSSFSSTSMPLCLKRLTTTSKSVSGKGNRGVLKSSGDEED